MGGAMAFTGIVTKVGAMSKTATVTVPRFVIHKRTGKVCDLACAQSLNTDKFLSLQRLERSTKILTHDGNNGTSRCVRSLTSLPGRAGYSDLQPGSQSCVWV